MGPLNESLMEKCEYEQILYGRESAEALVEKWAKRDPSAIKQVDELLAGIGVTMESVQAQARSSLSAFLLTSIIWPCPQKLAEMRLGAKLIVIVIARHLLERCVMKFTTSRSPRPNA